MPAGWSHTQDDAGRRVYYKRATNNAFFYRTVAGRLIAAPVMDGVYLNGITSEDQAAIDAIIKKEKIK